MPETTDAPNHRCGPGWLFDEVASAGRENFDVGHASRYDAKEDADTDDELVILKELGLDAHSEFVDMGAGTGQFALAAARECARVVAVDISPVMLGLLKAKLGERTFPSRGCAVGVSDLRARRLPGRLCLSRYALHHLPGFWKAVALWRARRVLRPGGILRLWDIVYNFDPAEAGERLEAWCATGGSDIEAAWSRAELEEHVRDEHSTFSWLLEPMLERPALRYRTSCTRPTASSPSTWRAAT